MKISRAWLQKYFEKPLPTGAEIEDAFTFHSFEIEESVSAGNDAILDVKVLPNRAADCMSHRGIAKDLAAILNVQITDDPLRKPIPTFTKTDTLTITVDNPELCDRYIGTVVHGVKVGPSPEWLKMALEAVGQRSINNVVDATNYVMFDIGQPLHAFDASRLSQKDGKYAINVRTATDGEKIVTLAGDEFAVPKDTLLIADGNSGKGVGVAGIKGGKAAEITEATTDIILESAHFNYAGVRKTAQRLKLFTDASSRFQNNPSPILTAYGMDAVIKLILDIAGGEVIGTASFETPVPENTPVAITREKINGVLGTTIPSEEIGAILERLDLPFSESNDTVTVTPPFERRDIVIPEDLVEEIGRIYGYDNIAPESLPQQTSQPEINKRFYYAEKARALLAENGFSEVLTYSFVPKGDIQILSSVAVGKDFLRTNLIEGVTDALTLNTRNADLLGIDSVRIFEIGRVFNAEDEHTSFAIAVRDPKAKMSKSDAIAQEIMESLKSIFPTISGTPKDGIIEWNFDELIAALPEPVAYEKWSKKSDLVSYAPISPYPFVLRDIAVWVPETVSKDELQNVITEKAGNLFVRLTPFDEFKKEGRVSYAFRLVFQSMEKTLSDEEVNAIMKEITNILNGQENWQVR